MYHARTTTNQESWDYRGGLVYQQEYGYKLITLTVSIAPGERSSVISYACNLPINEEREHLGSTDLYHFVVTDGTRIQLLIETLAGKKEAWYLVQVEDIVIERSNFRIDIVRSHESIPW